MKMPMFCAAALLALGMPANADPQYDRKLEKAVMEIVAAKMGALRAGFAYDARPAFVIVREPVVRKPAAPDLMVTGSIPARDRFAVRHASNDGLAAERKASRVITF